MAKKNNSGSPEDKKGKRKIKKLKLTKEVVKDLAAGEDGNIKGGRVGASAVNLCRPQ